jgi:hypothetical protein
MNRHDNRIISGIVSFIGIDYNLLKKSGEDNIAKFYLSGFLVLVIFALSFFSVFYAFDLMFHRWYAEFLLATFFSLTFLTIYLLLIQTFSKETLPASYKVTFFSTSNITRICFVFMISFLMAQPLKIFLLSDELDSDITNYKNDLYNNFLTRTNQLYQKDLRKLNQEKLRYIQLSDAAAIDKLDERMADIHTVMQTDQEEAQGEIDHSDFFLKRIAFAGKYPQSWFICLMVMFIFGLPVYLIYSISDNSKYYTEKRNHDHELVWRKYQEFKLHYSGIFQTRYRVNVEFTELYEDPPFNRVKKPEPTYLKTADLTEKIINHGL